MPRWYGKVPDNAMGNKNCPPLRVGEAGERRASLLVGRRLGRDLDLGRAGAGDRDLLAEISQALRMTKNGLRNSEGWTDANPIENQRTEARLQDEDSSDRTRLTLQSRADT